MTRPVNKGRPVNKAHALAAVLAASAMTASTAVAEDAAEPTVTRAAVSSSATTGSGFVQEDRAYTRMEAGLASANGHAVLHYGPDIWGADPAARAISRELSVEVFALAGGQEGQIELFVNGTRYGRFTQDNLDRGDVAAAVYQSHGIEMNGIDPFARERPVASLGGAE
jgi:hypothetical protein